MSNRNYILKPGVHQFAPGSHAVHHNENTTDEEIEWYLQRYPHISDQLEVQPATNIVHINRPKRPRLLRAIKVSPENHEQINEDLSPAN